MVFPVHPRVLALWITVGLALAIFISSLFALKDTNALKLEGNETWKRSRNLQSIVAALSGILLVIISWRTFVRPSDIPESGYLLP